MDKSVALRVAKRFITLPLDKRKLYLEKMLEEGVSPANLPIPETRSGFAAIPLSYAQERQLFLWQMDPHSTAYHIPSALRLKGRLEVAALERLVARGLVMLSGVTPSDASHVLGRLEAWDGSASEKALRILGRRRNGAGERAESLLDQRRTFAHISRHPALFLKETQTPLQRLARLAPPSAGGG